MGEYPTEFNEQLKEDVRSRQGYQCQQCGMSQTECLSRYGQKLSIHHKDEDKDNCSVSNLVALCKKCHQGTHFHQEMML